MCKFVRILWWLLVLLACSATALATPAYRATRFDGQFTPQFLNDAGQVAGIGQDGKPAIWNRDGSIVHLAGAAGQVTLTGFNNQGTVIGNATIPGYAQSQAVVWRNGGAMELLTSAGTGGIAAGLNNRGDIVGFNHNGSGPAGFILWGDGSAPQLFDDYRPHMINDVGMVLGGRRDEFGFRSWRDGVFADDRLPYDFEVRALNIQGQAAGYQDTGNAFKLLRQEGRWQRQDLWSAYAYDINDAGSVVGESEYLRAMLWYQDRPYVLDHLWNEAQYAGWFLRHAWQINAGGQILASGTSEWEHGATFLLSPVPEPAQGLLLLAGIALLGCVRVRSVR
ncbi:hypothetical protein [Pseudoduganella violaceinigra]|uniref:hypothetical protein n=1 Tax=Pseudoduganella violaceinigra TaxID=246602 RepID=UPI000421F096|nr:hypothetical protein [Pseudoduganella violaceinigra]